MDQSFDLYQELKLVLRALQKSGIEYALCGGLAVAIHGYARFTEDIDLVISESDLEKAKAALRDIGFIIDAGRIPFPKQQLEFYRVTKIVGSHPLVVDLLPVRPNDALWSEKQQYEWEEGSVHVLSIAALIGMKKKSERERDKNDVIELQRIQGSI